MDLVKIVRGLDQHGVGENGQHLASLWERLVKSPGGEFHAAEASALRWLLKNMNGQSEPAESLRRYPLTWAVLGCIFGRVPPFSLAKSLADRKFMVVLRQTLNDASRPADSSPDGLGKRKRLGQQTLDLASLRTRNGCIDTAAAVFSALGSLASRLNGAAASSHDKMGIEHIKSLFCTSAGDSAALLAPALVICNLFLATDIADSVEGCETWVEMLSWIWDLHLQSGDDKITIATHLWSPASPILSLFPSAHPEDYGKRDVLTRWKTDLSAFFYRNLVVPARASFLAQQDMQTIITALNISKESHGQSVPALYRLIATAPGQNIGKRTTKGETDWQIRIFQVCEDALRGRDESMSAVSSLLKLASEYTMPVGTAELYGICQRYALTKGHTDWAMVADILACDPYAFHTSDEGAKLLDKISARTVSQDTNHSSGHDIERVVYFILKGYLTGRDFLGFLTLWRRNMSLIESPETSTSPWLHMGHSSLLDKTVVSSVEPELSPTRLLEILREDITTSLDGPALCLFLSVVSEGITREDFKDVIVNDLAQLISKVPQSSTPLTALKWRVLARTVAWAAPDDRWSHWKLSHSGLSKVLRRSPLDSSETFEAFKYCCQAWFSMEPNEMLVSEPAELIETFMDRVSKENGQTPDSKKPMSDGCIKWYLQEASRMNKLYYRRKNKLAAPVHDILVSDASFSSDGPDTWSAILNNDQNFVDSKLAADFVGCLGSLLDRDITEKHWPGPKGEVLLQLLNAVSLEAFSRPQREQVMQTLEKYKKKLAKSPKHMSLPAWRLLLDLATRLLGRSTFYEGMKFSDLVTTADGLCKFLQETSSPANIITELLERFHRLAITTIRQMTENVDERSVSYLLEGSKFASKLDKQRSGSPFYMVLASALITETNRSSPCRNHAELGDVPTKSLEALTRSVSRAIKDLVTDESALTKDDVSSNMFLLAVLEAVTPLDAASLPSLGDPLTQLDKLSREAMGSGDLRAWKCQVLVQKFLPVGSLDELPNDFSSLDRMATVSATPLIEELVSATLDRMDSSSKLAYLHVLIKKYQAGAASRSQLRAIYHAINLFACKSLLSRLQGYRSYIQASDRDRILAEHQISSAFLEMLSILVSDQASPNLAPICKILIAVLEKTSQALGQSDIELSLSNVCRLSSAPTLRLSQAQFMWLCKVVETIIKKHRIRLEGRYHIIVAVLEELLRRLVTMDSTANNEHTKAAPCFARLITLISEPTAGAASWPQRNNSLVSAPDEAKRSAGRHMYFILMQYVKLQLETDIGRPLRELLEPAMNSIFDITPPEGRKILNDAMNSNGRALLREMFRRYTKFGKWTGV